MGIERSYATLAIAAAALLSASSLLAEDASGASEFASFELGTSATYARSGYSDGAYAWAVPATSAAAPTLLSVPNPSYARSLSLSPWFAVELGMPYFEAVGRLSGNTDGKYDAGLIGSSKLPLGTYYTIEEGGLKSQLGPVLLEVGRFRHYDAVQTPYSLFINGRGLSAPIGDIDYEGKVFFYETRWIGLNDDSTEKTPAWQSGFPDRGANYKDFGLRLGDMRFGLQDAAVYCGRYFDPEYFISPIPMYFTQYFLGTAGRPWTDGRNDNDILGFFWDWNRPDGLSFLSQLLIDDMNIHWLFPSTPDFPWKMAFSLGARKETPMGSFGLYLAGATEYTFEGQELTVVDPSARLVPGANEAIQSQNAYSYTYYPDTVFEHDWQVDPSLYSGNLAPISIEDNLIGYQFGENNIALRLDWKGQVAGCDLGAYLEFRLMGSNSPANSWHDLVVDPLNGTRWFDDPAIEKRLVLDMSGSRRFGAWRVFGELETGVAIDALRLSDPIYDATASDADNYVYIFEPKAGQIDPILRVTLGASYSIDIK
jgi:hypothetical protein